MPDSQLPTHRMRSVQSPAARVNEVDGRARNPQAHPVRASRPSSDSRRTVMTRLLRQLLCWYAAFCLTFAGVVGVSPFLHHLVDHGGQGVAHVHSRSVTVPRWQAHAHSHGTAHVAGHNRDIPIPFGRFRATIADAHESFRFSASSFARLWHALTHWVSGDADHSHGPSSGPADPDHHHGGLSQLLADGLIEPALEPPPFDAPFDTHRLVSLLPGFLPPNPRWDAQTAGRGPPLVVA